MHFENNADRHRDYIIEEHSQTSRFIYDIIDKYYKIEMDKTDLD